MGLGAVLNNWGLLAVDRGQTELAFQRFARGLALVEDGLRQEPGDVALRRSALELHGSRANLLGTLGRHAEAIIDWDRVVEFNEDPI